MCAEVEVRTITVHNVTYVRPEDIAEAILEVASTEETDVRTRLEKLAANIRQISVK